MGSGTPVGQYPLVGGGLTFTCTAMSASRMSAESHGEHLLSKNFGQLARLGGSCAMETRGTVGQLIAGASSLIVSVAVGRAASPPVSLRQHPRRLQFCFQQSPRAVSHGLRSRKWLPASLAHSAAFRSSLVASISRPAVSPPAFSHREPLAVSSLTVGCLMINIVPFAVCCRFSTSAASHRSVSAQAALMIDFSNRHAQHRR